MNAQKPISGARRYVQFSKRMVVFVSIAVTALSLIGMGLCFQNGDTETLGRIAQYFIGYATICFAAYSGNSAVEKWLIRRFPVGDTASETTENTDENG